MKEPLLIAVNGHPFYLAPIMPHAALGISHANTGRLKESPRNAFTDLILVCV